MSVDPIGVRVGRLAEEAPDRPAITSGGRTITRGDLDRGTNRLARAYAALGVGQGDLVTVGLPNGIEFYEAAIAAWKLGATPQPISWRLPERERRQIVDLANPALVVGVEGSAGDRPSVAPGFRPDPALDDGPLPPRTPPSLKVMTSGGSTGRPKLVVVAEQGSFDSDRRPLGMQPHQVQLVCGPLYHNAPFTSTLGLLTGQQLVVLERFDAEEALRAIERHRVAYLQLVPTMMLRIWRVLERDPGAWDLSSLEAVWHMAAPCPEWLKQTWIDLVGPDKLFELYGGTEGQSATHITGTEWLAHRGSVGRPALGEIRIVGPDGDDVPTGTEGEVFMRRGEGVPASYRYLGAEARKLPGGWETIGDLGRLDEEGYLYLSDRRTDLILSGGANVYPAEVESVILEHPRVLSCVVVGLPDEDLGQRVHAVVQSGGPVDEEELRRFVGDRLVRFKVPRSFRFVDEALRDDAGKVRRSAIRDQEAALAGPLCHRTH